MMRNSLCFSILLICLSTWVCAQNYHIGDIYTAPDGSRGIVYYLHPDGSGGWMVALEDASMGCAWGDNTDVPGLANQSPIHHPQLLNDTSGYSNTQILRSYQDPSMNYAATVVDFANGWILPSPAQLRILYGKLSFISSFIINAGGTDLASDYYWSSGERDALNAWLVSFDTTVSSGSIMYEHKTNYYRVRAVRCFSNFAVDYDTSLTYLWNTGNTQPYINVSPTQTTTYTVTGTTNYGCTATAEQTVLVGNGDTQTIYDTICKGAGYEANGFSLTSVETDSIGTFFLSRNMSIGECGSILTLSLTILPSKTFFVEDSACERYTWNGATYYEGGVYTQYFNDYNSCDSIVTLNLIIYYPINTTIDTTVCGSYDWYGETYLSSGIYTHRHENDSGCICTDTLRLTILQEIHEVTDTIMCENFEWKGETFTTSGTYSHQYYNERGCLSVDTLHLIINTGTYNYFDTTVCKDFEWHRDTLFLSGTYFHYYYNEEGCFSVDTLHLTIDVGTHSVIDTIVCGNYEWYGETYSSSGTYTHNYINEEGCPSVDTLHLTINADSHLIIDTIACENFDWHGEVYSSSGTYTHNYYNEGGCLSVDTLHLTINTSSHIVLDTTICESYEWNGVNYTSSGIYTYNYNNYFGCLCTDTLYLTINTPTHGNETISAIDTFLWHGTTYNQSGIYLFGHLDANGCNQIDTLHLTLHYSSSEEISVVACESYTWNDTNYTVSGDYLQAFQNIYGADSIVTLHLTINHGSHNSFDTSVCERYTWINGSGETFTSSGTYIYDFVNTVGCSSVDTLHLTINPVYDITLNDIICEGEAYNDYGFVIPSSQTLGVTNLNFTRNLLSQYNCDSIVNLNLTVIDTSITINSLTVDFCDEYFAELTVETNLMNYQWSTGETSPTIIATQPGLYTVTATQGNCSISAWYYIETCELNVYLPNTITPGEKDGVNDYFGLHDVYKSFIEDFEIRIYSRWGELVYYSDDKNFKWFGEYHGRINRNVMYTYLINFTDRRGVPYQLTGNITVL